jgi:hypothetical protein
MLMRWIVRSGNSRVLKQHRLPRLAMPRLIARFMLRVALKRLMPVGAIKGRSAAKNMIAAQVLRMHPLTQYPMEAWAIAGSLILSAESGVLDKELEEYLLLALGISENLQVATELLVRFGKSELALTELLKQHEAKPTIETVELIAKLGAHLDLPVTVESSYKKILSNHANFESLPQAAIVQALFATGQTDAGLEILRNAAEADIKCRLAYIGALLHLKRVDDADAAFSSLFDQLVEITEVDWEFLSKALEMAKLIQAKLRNMGRDLAVQEKLKQWLMRAADAAVIGNAEPRAMWPVIKAIQGLAGTLIAAMQEDDAAQMLIDRIEPLTTTAEYGLLFAKLLNSAFRAEAHSFADRALKRVMERSPGLRQEPNGDFS